MNIDRAALLAAAARARLTPEQAEAVWQALQSDAPETTKARFDAVHVLYYLGALLVIGAMGWFVTQGWDGFAGWELSAVAAAYAAAFLLAGAKLWTSPSFRVPAGLLLTMAVGMTPLAVFGLEKSLGLWPADDPRVYSHFHPFIDGSWIIMEIATVLAGLLAVRRWRFPFLTAPIAYALWYLSMDLPQLLLGSQPFSWDEKKMISVGFGVVMLVLAYLADLRGRKDIDFAFWGYLFGLATFWGALTSMDGGDEFTRLFYCIINLALMVASLVLRRRVFMVFGAFGLFVYLGHLAYSVFKDSVVFPFALTALGVGMIVLGVVYQRRRQRIEQGLRQLIGPGLQRLLPPHARG